MWPHLPKLQASLLLFCDVSSIDDLLPAGQYQVYGSSFISSSSKRLVPNLLLAASKFA